MNWLFIALIILILLIIIISITKITIDLYYSHDHDNDELTVKLKAWRGLLTYTISVPLIKVDKESASIVVEEEEHLGEEDKPTGKTKEKKITPSLVVDKIQEMYDFLRHVVGLHKIIRDFFKRVSITKLDWQSQLGVGDAAHTGFLAGIAWGIKGTIVGIMANHMILKVRPNLAIQPLYQSKQSYTRLRCMFSFRVGYAIGAAIQIARHWKRRKRKWQTIQYKT